jgi:hypothetical protein
MRGGRFPGSDVMLLDRRRRKPMQRSPGSVLA